MTIALGITCSDGAIIAADRQITKEGGLKYEQKKISSCKVNGSIPLEYAFVYANDPDSAKILEHEVGRALCGGICSQDVFMTDFVIRDLQPVFKRKESKDVEAIILLGSPTIRPFLLRTRRSLVVRGHIECIGVGDSSVIHYFSDLLPPEMTLKQAKPVVAYLVDLASRYIEGCGLGSDITFIGKNGIVEEISKEEKMSYGQDFKKLEASFAARLEEMTSLSSIPSTG